MKKVLIIFLVILFSCESNEQKFILKSQNVEGLSLESSININGFKVGKINDFNLVKNKVYVEVSLKDELNIPLDSKFTKYTSSLMGSASIGVELGKQKFFLNSGDTILLLSEEMFSSKKIDTIGSIIGKAIKDIVEVLDKDSIQ